MREDEGDPCPVFMVNLDDAMVGKEGRRRKMREAGVGCKIDSWSVWVSVSKLAGRCWWGECCGMKGGM